MELQCQLQQVLACQSQRPFVFLVARSADVASNILFFQCTSVCPSGALKEQSKLTLISDALKAGKVVVASVAPSVRVAIGEEFGLPPGTISTGKAVMALKRVGVSFVFDVNFGVRTVCLITLIHAG